MDVGVGGQGLPVCGTPGANRVKGPAQGPNGGSKALPIRSHRLYKSVNTVKDAASVNLSGWPTETVKQKILKIIIERT